MPLTGSINLDDSRLRRALGKYSEHIEKQMPRAINVAVARTRTEIRQTVTRDEGVRAQAVRDKVVSVNATRANWNAGVVISVKKIGLSDYKVFKHAPGGSKYKGGGVIRVRRRAFRVLTKRNKYGRSEVFERTSRKAKPIVKAYGGSAWAVLKNKIGVKPARRRMVAKTINEFKRLVDVNVV